MTVEQRAIRKINVSLIVRIGSREMLLREVMSLTPGAIIELPKQADEELEVLINNVQIGLGKAVRVGQNFGVRVSFIGDVRKRIAALAAENPVALDEGIANEQ